MRLRIAWAFFAASYMAVPVSAVQQLRTSRVRSFYAIDSYAVDENPAAMEEIRSRILDVDERYTPLEELEDDLSGYFPVSFGPLMLSFDSRYSIVGTEDGKACPFHDNLHGPQGSRKTSKNSRSTNHTDDGHVEEKCPVPRSDTDGQSFYKLLPVCEGGCGKNEGQWTQALEQTPEGCTLAPVRTEEDVRTIQSELGTMLTVLNRVRPTAIWLGITKSVANVDDDNEGDGSRANWINLDGTPAEILCNEGLWLAGQPNNHRLDRYAALRGDGESGGLVDFGIVNMEEWEEDITLDFLALYKCC